MNKQSWLGGAVPSLQLASDSFILTADSAIETTRTFTRKSVYNNILLRKC